MRIAILGIKGLPASAGADRVVEKLLERMGSGHEITVYLADRPGPKLACGGNRRYVYVPTLRGKHLAAASYFLLSALHVVVRGRFDLAHVHNSDFGLFCAILRLRPGLRVLGTFHGEPYLRTKWGPLARAFLRLSERAFTDLTHHLTSVARTKSRARGVVRSRSVTYVPNGVDPYWNAATPGTFDLAVRGLVRGRYVLFAAGRLDRTKGLHHLLDAFGRIDDEPPGGGERLLVVGDFSHDPAYADEIRARAADDDRIVLHEGLLDRSSLLDVVKGCRVFAFPSDVEAMSMMLLEAVSCRRPVVCSDIPENVDVVGGEHPYLFHAGDPSDLARRLRAALRANPPGAGADGATADLFDRCMTAFGWASIAARYERLYRQLGPAKRPRAA